MAAISKPMMGRTARGATASDLSHDIAYDYRRRIGAYFRDLREKANMPQADVAKVLGVYNTAISAMEHGRSTISPERYADLADLFGVNRKTMGRFLLRYTNPWLFAMLYGEEALGADAAHLPERITDHRRA